MPNLAEILQAGAANPWIYLPVAVLLGALHALEPGHSKSLMAAFIIAVRGTVAQAALLGVAAAIGHTIIVWGLALAGLMLGDKLIAERAEPWLMLISGLMVIGLAARIVWLARRGEDHDHDHDHHDDDGDDHHDHHHDHDHHHGDAHAVAHARDIESRFAGRRHVGNLEIAWFGFTGGLMPCPAAIAVLLICLQLKQVTLGAAMVAAFSVGLAVTLVSVGVVAAWGTRHAARRWVGFDAWAERLPYISAALVMTIGFAITLRGLALLGAFGA